MLEYNIKKNVTKNNNYICYIEYWDSETPGLKSISYICFPPGVEPTTNSIAAKIKQLLYAIENKPDPPQDDYTLHELREELLRLGEMTEKQTFKEYIASLEVK
jgi:hypothetical protein